MSSIVVDNIKGLYKRRHPSRVPFGYLKTAENVDIEAGSIVGRPDSIRTAANAVSWTAIKRVYAPDPTSNTTFFVLSGTTLYYTANSGTTLVTVITGITADSDFSILRIFDKYFISFHNGTSPRTTNYQVFDPSIHSSSRDALGTAPNSAPTVTVAGGAGTKNISAGVHLWGVAFVSDTGHVSAVDASCIVAATHAGGQMADLSNIPTGPAGTTARWILATKVIPNYSGNTLNYELFFVQQIADNSTTTLNNVEFYDDELVDSADYLKDLYEVLDSSLGMCSYENRVVLWNTNGISAHTLTISDKGKPESFDQTTGVISVDEGYGVGIQCVVDLRGTLVIFKHVGTYITRDNGGEPNTWPVERVDGGYGTRLHGVCRVFGGTFGSVQDVLLVLTTTGLLAFDGQYNPRAITENIDSVIEDAFIRYGFSVYKYWQVFADTLEKKIYISLAEDPELSPTSPYIVLVGNYEDGLSPDTIKWSRYSFSYDVSVAAVHPFVGIFTMPRTSTGGGLCYYGATEVFKLVTEVPLSTSNEGKDGRNAAATPDGFKYPWSIETWGLYGNDVLAIDQIASARVYHSARSAASAVLTVGNSPAQSVTLSNASTLEGVLLMKPTNSNMLHPTFKLASAATLSSSAYLEHVKIVVLDSEVAALNRPR